MKRMLLILVICAHVITAYGQKQVFDIMSYTAPKGWKADTREGVVSYSITNKQKGGWCLINLIKSSPSLGDIDTDFNDDWQQLIVKPYGVVEAPQIQAPTEEDGWKIKAGVSKFEFNKAPAIVLLTTVTGYNTRVAIVAITNTQDYMPEIEKLMNSLNLQKPTITKSKTSNDVGPDNVQKRTSPDNFQKKDGYAFNTTTFDDGWTSAIYDNWVEVKKGDLRVLLHYPRPMKDHKIFPAEPVTAWDTLVSSRYSNLKDFNKTYINSYYYTEMAYATVTENVSGKSKFVVIFHRSGGGWIEVVSPDKPAFVKEFKFDPTVVRWDSNVEETELLANMPGRNRFAVAAKDLYGTGEWNERFSSNTFYTNYYTGAYAGMSTYSSSQWFVFGKGQTYTWELVATNSYSGQTKFANAKGAGTFNAPNNWQLYFSDIEGKSKTYDAYFSAVKGGRVLWLNDAKNPGSGVFTGYSKK